jgi:hypothetical protein
LVEALSRSRASIADHRVLLAEVDCVATTKCGASVTEDASRDRANGGPPTDLPQCRLGDSLACELRTHNLSEYASHFFDFDACSFLTLPYIAPPDARHNNFKGDKEWER